MKKTINFIKYKLGYKLIINPYIVKLEKNSRYTQNHLWVLKNFQQN